MRSTPISSPLLAHKQRNLMTESHIRNVIEAALLAAGKPLQAAELVDLFAEAAERPTLAGVQAALAALSEEYSTRGIEIKETAAGFRIQVRADFSNEISRLWPERPAKYSRALLETLAIIAYRQPITRAEIEAVRGVAVNPNIVKTVIERNWVHVVGHRDVPGRPELLGTTRDFLDYFGLKRLDELPPLAELKSIGEIKVQFDLPDPGPLALASDAAGAAAEPGATDGAAATGEAANAAASNTHADNATADSADVATANAEAATADSADVAIANAEAATADSADVAIANAEAATADSADVAIANAEAASADPAKAAGNSPNTAGVVIAASGDADATSGDAISVGTAENAAPERAHEGVAVKAPADGTSAHATSTEGALGAPLSSAEHASGAAALAGEPTAETSTNDAAPHAIVGETSAAPDAPATKLEDLKKPSPSAGRGSGRKKKRGKSQISDSALHEAEEFAASVDADLAAGDDDSSDEDELSAAGPDSSELVAGPRDIDD
jgi:segregation and condensation protein B